MLRQLPLWLESRRLSRLTQRFFVVRRFFVHLVFSLARIKKASPKELGRFKARLFGEAQNTD